MQNSHLFNQGLQCKSNTQDYPYQVCRIALHLSPPLRKISLILKSACFLFIISGVFLVLTPAWAFEGPSKEIAIITATSLNVRPEAGNHKPPINILGKGTRVRILKHHEGWLEIIHEGQVGFIRNRESYVKIIEEIEAPETEPNQSEIQRFKQQAEDIGLQLEKSRTEVLSFTQKEISTIDRLNKIDMELNTTRQRVSSLKSEIVELEKEIEKNTNLSTDLIKKIHSTEKYASERLVALYKLLRLGRFHILASSESIHDLFLRKTTLERILVYDENIRKNLMENKARLEKLLERQKAIKEEKLSLETTYNEQIRIITVEKSNRSKLLDDIRSKKSLELAAIESLKQAAIQLDQTIKSLNLELIQPQPADDEKQKSFTDLKGLLKMPVKGKIVSFYGPYKNTQFNVVNFRSGINIKADRGEPIRSVLAGKTMYSSWFKGYGNMIIIDHGDNYYTVYAHVEELFKKKGDRVETGEVIATVGDTASMYGPGLYFEIRHHGKPIDPLLWIKEG